MCNWFSRSKHNNAARLAEEKSLNLSTFLFLWLSVTPSRDNIGDNHWQSQIIQLRETSTTSSHVPGYCGIILRGAETAKDISDLNFLQHMFLNRTAARHADHIHEMLILVNFIICYVVKYYVYCDFQIDYLHKLKENLQEDFFQSPDWFWTSPCDHLESWLGRGW